MMMNRGVGLGVVGMIFALASGCGAAPSDAPSQNSESTSESAYTQAMLPEAVCTLIAGVDTSHLQADQAVMRVGGGSNGGDPSVMAFQRAIGALGGTGEYTIRAGVGKNSTSWYAIDVTRLSASAVSAVVGQYPASPVSAGYYECSYLWGDYELPPGGKHPYVPGRIVAYDPRGCSSCE